MKVKCLGDFTGGTLRENSPWLTVGKVYRVLELFQGSDGRLLVRIISDNRNGAALFGLSSFEVVSRVVPDAWIVDWNQHTGLTFSPAAWLEVGYWERFYDDDPDALRIFESEVLKIESCEP